MENNLTHWGIKGMKWGQRRYQNKDGSLTPAGEKRYARDAHEKGYKQKDESGAYYKISGKKGKRDVLDVDADRYFKEDLTRTKKLTEETSTLANKLKSANDQSIKNKPKVHMDLSNMTDKEMRDQINRAMLERQYIDAFAPQTVSKGKEYTSKILETAGTALTITSSALAVALSIKELKG